MSSIQIFSMITKLMNMVVYTSTMALMDVPMSRQGKLSFEALSPVISRSGERQTAPERTIQGGRGAGAPSQVNRCPT